MQAYTDYFAGKLKDEPTIRASTLIELPKVAASSRTGMDDRGGAACPTSAGLIAVGFERHVVVNDAERCNLCVRRDKEELSAMSIPTPPPGNPRRHALRGRRKSTHSRSQPHRQAGVKRRRAGTQPQGDRGLARQCPRSLSLSRRRLRGIACGAGTPQRPRSRPHRLRRRLGRADRHSHPRLCRTRRRGAAQPLRVPHVRHHRHRQRRDARAGARARHHRRRGCPAGEGDAQDPNRLSRQPQQPYRHLSAVTARSAGCTPGCRARCCWCSTPPTRNI